MGRSRSKTNQAPDTVVIHVTTGVLKGLVLSVLGLMAVAAVFWIGLNLGQGRAANVAAQPAYYPQQAGLAQPAPVQPAVPQQQAAPAAPQVSGADQSAPRVTSPPAGDQIPIGDNPRLALPQLGETNYVMDFGETPVAGGPVTKETTIRNSGAKDLVIADVETTCSCTQASVAESTVPPGGETVLRVTHDPQVMLNHGSTSIAHQILISSNDPAAPWVEFDMAGMVTQ